MPYARISLLAGKPPGHLRAVADGLHRALVETFGVPPDDRFQVIHQHAPGELIFDREYGGGPRSDDFVLIHLAIGRPRDTPTKLAFYRRLAALLAESPGLDPEDVMVVISTGAADEWSFAGGRAMLVAAAP